MNEFVHSINLKMYGSKWSLRTFTIGPIIMAEMIVPSRTPMRNPKNTIDKAAAIITNDVSTKGFTFANSFFNALEMATMNPSGGKYTTSVWISSRTPKATTIQLTNNTTIWLM